jgi:hypothetical protein
MSLFQAGELVLERKCLGILSLPLITLNGTTRSANMPPGNAMEHYCGYNYQHGTLDKFLRELKYIGIPDRLLREQVSFWQSRYFNGSCYKAMSRSFCKNRRLASRLTRAGGFAQQKSEYCPGSPNRKAYLKSPSPATLPGNRM